MAPHATLQTTYIATKHGAIEEQQCAKGLILAGCAKIFSYCKVGREGIDLVLTHFSGMSQVVIAQIAPHPRHVASDGAICITPHQHFLAIALQQSCARMLGSFIASGLFEEQCSLPPPTKIWANAKALVKLKAMKCLARGMQTSWLGIRPA